MRWIVVLSLVVALLCAGPALAQVELHLKQINPSDQARARAMLLRKSDLGGSYYRYGRLRVIPDDEDSPNPFCTLSSPQLVVTGEASGPDFDWPTAYISSVGQVYATLDDSDASWLFGTSAVGEKCTRDDIESAVRKAGGRLVSPFRRVASPPLRRYRWPIAPFSPSAEYAATSTP